MFMASAAWETNLRMHCIHCILLLLFLLLGLQRSSIFTPSMYTIWFRYFVFRRVQLLSHFDVKSFMWGLRHIQPIDWCRPGLELISLKRRLHARSAYRDERSVGSRWGTHWVGVGDRSIYADRIRCFTASEAFYFYRYYIICQRRPGCHWLLIDQ